MSPSYYFLQVDNTYCFEQGHNLQKNNLDHYFYYKINIWFY